MVFNLLFPLWLMLTPVLRFGVNNDNELAHLNVLFAARVRVWLFLCWLLHGLSPLVVDGLRSPAEQTQRHKEDARNPLNPGNHGSGEAVDMNFLRNGVIVLRKASTPAAWAPVYVLADLCGISNGSTFRGYPDNNHFYQA
ncbi:MAG: hypothetical protein EOO37_00110 [Cytophagaceae bacterium]|nr:MAG: hypothetical protein EOO37_00110 [Cytophagaceae bacterium]